MKVLKAIYYVFFLALLAALVYFLGTTLYARRERLLNYFFPCSSPIIYRIGSIDSRFGVSQKELLGALKDAESIWEKPVSKNLFTYDEGGFLAVRLIYDYRQEATERLETLGIALSDDEATYDSLKARYNSMNAEYEAQKAGLDSLVAEYNRKKSAYDSRVAFWNDRGGAPKAEFKALQQEKTGLLALVADIKAKEASLNDLIITINALAGTMNRLAGELNLNVRRYNAIGDERGEEFEEGTYSDSIEGGNITIYEFDSRERLVRVLAHEFGHALGLKHVDDPRAILYRLNRGANEKLSATDLNALKKKCRMEE